MAGKKAATSSKPSKSTEKGKSTKNTSNGNSTKEAVPSSIKLKPANAVKCRHILCSTVKKREEAETKLKNGAKFDEVAVSFSEDKAKYGGSLGWQPRNQNHPLFEKAAFALNVSTTKKPDWLKVDTPNGFHLVMVEGRR